MDDKKKLYLERRQQEVSQVKKEILKKKCLELAQIVGHRLKGHGNSFGFPEISQIGLQLELSAKDQDFKKSKALIDQLEKNIKEQLSSINV